MARKVTQSDKAITISSICKKLKMSRQNYYKQKAKGTKAAIDHELILHLVKQERCIQHRLGGKKLHKFIKKECQENGISLGRDRFFDLLRENSLLIEKKKGKPRTTNSRHSLPVFHNLIANIDITRPNQAWACDLTYISTREGFMYASLITDMYSRKIVGAHIGDSLETYGCIAALEKALSKLPSKEHPIHHSDRGTQYCCHEYVKRLNKREILISMTEANHCYENAMAERVNGILKQEYELDQSFKTKEQAKNAFYQAVYLYNNRRPHLSLKYEVPAKIHSKAA